MKIWQLQSLLNEDFQSLQLVHFEQDYNKYFDKRFFEVEPMFEFWQPVEVYSIEGKGKVIVRHFGDAVLHLYLAKGR
ncbi:hypothetical protein [Laceyella tengchongensis]